MIIVFFIILFVAIALIVYIRNSIKDINKHKKNLNYTPKSERKDEDKGNTSEDEKDK